MKIFEVFVQNEEIKVKDWQALVKKVKKYDERFSFEIKFELNTVRFFLYSKANLALLSTEVKKFLIIPSKENKLSKNLIKKSLKLPSSKNILEFKEKQEIKKERFIKSIKINFGKFLSVEYYKVQIIFAEKKNRLFQASYLSFSNPLFNLEVDFKQNPKIKKASPPLFPNIEETINRLSTKKDEAFLEVPSFHYFSQPLYLCLKNFDFAKHSLIVGQTGTGKSKMIELLIKQLIKNQFYKDYCIILIDPHAVIFSELDNLISVIDYDYITSSCELFPSFSEPKIATELTLLLFKTLLKEQFQAKLERVLKYSLYLLFKQNKMSLFNLKKFLTELEFRKQILLKTKEDHLSHFFDTEFAEIQTKFYEIAIMPILVLIDELSFIPSLQNPTNNSLEQALTENFLTCFSLNRLRLGEKATRLIAGLLIQQAFLIAQKGSINKKMILIIDEVSVVENESLVSILSEARKYNLSLFLAQQYLTQISPSLLKAILSNVYNYFIFKVSDEDARILTKNLEIKFPDKILIEEKKKGLSAEDLKRHLLITLNPRECIARIFANGRFYPCFKAKTLKIS